MTNLGLRKPLLVVGDFSTKLPSQTWATGIWPTLTSILGMFHELYVVREIMVLVFLIN